MRFTPKLPCVAMTACLSLGVVWTQGLSVAAEEAAVAEETVEDAVDADQFPLATEGPTPKPVTPPTAAEVQSAIERGVDFLVASQRKSGAWGGPQRTKELNIYAPGQASHLAFRTGCTGLAVEALCGSRELFDGERREQVEAAIDRGQAWLLEHGPKLTRAEPDAYASMMGHALYNVWGHSYAIQGALALYERARGDEALQQRLRGLIAGQIRRLEGCNYINGGWGYYDEIARTKVPSGSPNSFTTATALIALKKAEALDLHYPQPLTAKAIDSILRQRHPDFSYAYGEYLRMYPRMYINRPGGSLGRSQACNLALRMYGHEEVTDAIFKTWLDRLYARNGWLSIARKRPVPHDSDFSVAGYFYYYGHYYAAMCIEELPADERPYFQDHLAHILLPLQEKDGSWWDYPLYDYHQSWGTAMAVSALVRCRHEAE